MSEADRHDFVVRARRDARPLAGLDFTLPPDDLGTLAAIVGNARIVGIGESWHHAHEILKLKFRLVRFLIERVGFNTVVFEGGLPGSEVVDSFVSGGDGNAPALLRTFGQPMWLNPETVEFIEWLRAHNAAVTAPDKVRTFGMDIGYPAAAIFDTLAYLDRVDATFAVPDRELVAGIGRRLQEVRFGSLTKSAMYGSSDVYDALDAATKERFRLAFTEIVARLAQRRAQYIASSSHALYERMLRYATVVLQAHGVIDVRSSNLGLANDRRDLAFAENITWIARQVGRDARLVVLAHNVHVARDPFKSDPLGPAITSTGGHLAQWYGRDYVAIGTAVGRGRLLGGDSGLVPSLAADVTIDAVLEEVGREHFLLDVPAEIEFARQAHGMRSHLAPQPEYVLAQAFDALAYLDRIERAKPIDRAAGG